MDWTFLNFLAHCALKDYQKIVIFFVKSHFFIYKIGYECSCHPGFRKRADDPSLCDDIDECQELFPCSQMCLNTPGSYHCACYHGYAPANANASSCKANTTDEFKLLFTSKYYIKVSDRQGTTKTLVKNQTNAVAIGKKHALKKYD